MAKLIKTYENGIEKFELVFRGETFDFSMLPTDYGRKGDKPVFDAQVKKKLLGLADDALLDLLDQLSWESDENEILDILEQIEEWEENV